MKCYTWSRGSVSEGIALKQDDRLGPVVYLGEASTHKRDGRRYEAVSLSRRNPPAVVESSVLEATPVQITLHPKPGLPEKKFYVLEASPATPEAKILVRINANGGYTRGGSGGWSTETGTPEDLISGCGEFGDAGRLGGWSDGLVVLKPSDVLRVSPTVGAVCALWIENGAPTTARWKEYEQIMAVAAAEATMAKAAADPQALPTVFGMMPAYTYSGGGNIASGITVTKGATGPVVSLGEKARGSTLTEVPIVGLPAMERIERAAVAELSRKETPGRYSYEGSTVKVIYGLTKAETTETGTVLLHLAQPLPRGRCHVSVDTVRGQPIQLAHGNVSAGDAGRVGSAPHELYVLREGDALKTGVYDRPWWVIELKDGKPTSTRFEDWEIADAATRPAEYAAKGKAPWGHVPTDWVGRVVTIVHRVEEWDSQKREYYYEMREGKTGEVIATAPLILNLGWDGQDRNDIVVESGVWVKLETGKTARRMSDEEVVKRAELRTKAEYLRGKAKTATEETFFKFLGDELRQKIEKLADPREADFAQMPTEGSWGSLARWVSDAQSVMTQFVDAEPAAIELEKKQSAGEVLCFFTAWHRRGGATNVGDGFVIRPDGSLRERDSDDVRQYKHDGTYRWLRVEADELALVYSKAYTAAPHEGTVTHKPVGGCTPQQLERVRAIEQELGAPAGVFDILGLGKPQTATVPKIETSWTPAPLPSEAPQGAKEGVVSPADFSSEGDGYFKCRPCGTMNRLTKSKRREWKAGAEVALTCTKCGRWSGNVKR